MRYSFLLNSAFVGVSIILLSGCAGQRYSLSETVPKTRDVIRAAIGRVELKEKQTPSSEKVIEDVDIAFQFEIENSEPEVQKESVKQSEIILAALTEDVSVVQVELEPVALPLPIPEPATISEHTELPSVEDCYIPGGHGMTLAQFEQLALDNNPTIRLLSAAASRANGVRNQVGLYPNPTVGYSASQLADQGTDQHVLFYEQEFVRGNKLALNERVLSRATQAQMWEVEAQRYRVLTDIRIRYYEAVASQRIKELAKEFAKVTKRGAEIAQLRRDALEGTQIDVLQAQIQMNEIEIRQQQAEYAYQGAWKDLTAIAGMPYLAPAPLIDEMKPETIIQDWDSTYQSMLCSSPELTAAQVRVSQARANLDRQKVQATSNVTVQLGAGVDNATNSGLINLQFAAPLPIYNKNTGNISAAYAQFCQATHEVKRIEMAIKSRLARVSQEYDAAKVAVLKYEQQIIPKAEETLKLSDEAYQVGELNFLQMLIVRRTYFESNLQSIGAIRKLAQAQAKIDGLLLSGGLEKPDSFSGDDALRGQTFSGQ